MLKAIFKPIVILGLQPTRIDQQLLIQNIAPLCLLKFRLTWAILHLSCSTGLFMRLRSGSKALWRPTYVYQQLSFRYH